MNKIIWRDIESTEIKGLMICELPPITKPKMRVQETQIDGVDGSIIEELGYESYDKTITIGLYKDFDIDEVIEYFTGEGNVTFSNEAERYYKARIIEQIDYERLLRYRTATVKFRVQPFKYEYQEEKIGIVLNENGGKNLFNPNEPTSSNLATRSYENNILTITSVGTDTRYFVIYNIDTEEGDVIRFSSVLMDENCHVMLQEYTPEFVQVANVYAVYTDGVMPSLLEYRKKDANNRTRLVFYTDINVPNGERTARYQNCILTINHEDMTYEETSSENVINSLTVTNKGNYFSKPVIKIEGSGTIEFTVNDNKIFSYTFPEDETEVVIDSQKQDAYLDSILKNRNMSGEFPIFKKDENVITWNGTISSIRISLKSRWV